MNFPFKDYPLIGHWVPGFVVVLIISLSVYTWGLGDLAEAAEGFTQISVFFSGLAFIVIPFVVGQFLDSIRDLLIEYIWDRDPKRRVNWDFFCYGGTDKLKNLEQYYFIYYVFNWNLALGIIVSIILFFFLWCLSFIQLPPCEWIFLGLGIATFGLLVFIWDAVNLRDEIRRHSWQKYEETNKEKT